MRFSYLTFARVYNTGNYENQRIEIECELSEDDDPEMVLAQMKEFVQRNRPRPTDAFERLTPE